MAAEKTLNARLKLLYKTSAEWEANKDFVLLKGEAGVEDGKLIKIGDGLSTWENLNYLQAVASDVHDWAKKESLEYGDLDEDFIAELKDLIDETVPKDLVLKSGELKTVTTANKPYTGAAIGDKYLDLELNSEEADHIYIPVSDLVDNYTAGEGISIDANNEVSVVNRTVQDLTGANGTARIWNESDGGGVQFVHNDGTKSFTGVNDGGKNGITGQLYSVDTKNGNLGTRLNMTNDGFFYFKGKTGATQYTAKDEIATKGDIENANENLADIASSGNVKDLVQDAGDYLIIDGNG